jgi:hypothetical protein
MLLKHGWTLLPARWRPVVALASLGLGVAAPALADEAVGTAFTYQGRLEDGEGAVTDTCDLRFRIYDAGVGGNLEDTDVVTLVDVQDGLFTVEIDFGNDDFLGYARWLEVAVRCPAGAGAYQVLDPRQELTPAVYAIGLALPYRAEYEHDEPLLQVTNTGGGTGVMGTSEAFSGIGVRGEATHPGGESHNANFGGYFRAAGKAARAVFGHATAVEGNNYGGLFYSESTLGAGVWAAARAESGTTEGGLFYAESPDGSGAVGIHLTTTGTAPGVHGQTDSVSGGSATDGATGVLGEVTFHTPGAWSAGVRGINHGTAGLGVGVIGYQNGCGFGVYGQVADPDCGYAGYFSGRVRVTGTLSKGGGSFQIDHPLDPENKYLFHSFVESPDMMNIYNGNVTTDEQGEAWIEMPEWFQALNRDFRYQLTVIGQFADAMVAREIEDNRFLIRTDKPSVRVSWQVTGIRHDPFAEHNRIPVEQAKPEHERGSYLHPEEWGQPRERGIDAFDPAQVSAPRNYLAGHEEESLDE